MYAYPAGTSFCSCASSRAALHVGSLFLWNRHPSNAPPLLLSPTGRATRRGPLMQNTLGGTPKTPTLVGRNLRLNRADPPLHYGQPSPLRCALLPPQGLTTLRGPPTSPPLPRSGGGGSCPTYRLSYFSAWQVPTAISTPRQICLPHPLAATREVPRLPCVKGGGERSEPEGLSALFVR